MVLAYSQLSRALVAALLVALGTDEESQQALTTVNSERARLDLPPARIDERLQQLAQQRVEELMMADDSAFDVLGPDEVLERARSQGYWGRLVQELAAVGPQDLCELFESWNDSTEEFEMYRRHETRDIGFAHGFLDDSRLWVLVVGVPNSPSFRRLEPGVAPREAILKDLLDHLARRRIEAGLAPFIADEALSRSAQAAAMDILRRAEAAEGIRRVPGASVVWCRGFGELHHSSRSVADYLFSRDRKELLSPGTKPVGLGLASRERGSQLEAAWVLLLPNPP